MGVSVQQLLIILAIIVLLFGAKKIPELAKGVGKGIKSFKKEMEDDPKLEESVKKESETTKADESQKA
ncbi:twin-arginine translocase TatA/TatE family subunit [Campylobacter sp. JMF_01 NE2]|uniref:twin-arginine translocase TatA/TatE family subunit n=1 Tax=unclassified Campylobacter TaxID=2593542 RepID=UPI001B543D46|nr:MULTISPECIES: twin-arginine translocase TatA/TatE family subunit [unclassified Campylobacter]MBP3224802.1 twin-arginine translocase TatA/TatE family subunit [Campylobacter sp.]MDA3042510.1 twin-arginine translocase TatA/TatE family subunit [Campylobacter sp. JMF_09 ED2]MDA3044676.1 twin-arginine translocase TatA/TatE family subunit [Campylobacter sp. JMF_07 ED4]MDA3046257.1 twin-arginine translocase TatA/TatE family subunit [Campylobacter sp. VBCF_06 NA8]MDA3047150.1 twin-arginine transloca